MTAVTHEATRPAGGIGWAAQAVRRSPSQARRDFRSLLDVLARPGLTARLVPSPDVPAATVPAACLADVEVPLAVIGGEDWARALALATGAPAADPENARMVLALRPLTPAEIAALPRGDALHPELGCRLVQAVDGLSEGPDAGGVVLTLNGPGVPGERRLTVKGMPAESFHALAEANAAFPAGTDTFLVAPDGTVAGLPRSVRMTIENGGTG
ncbi:phosphonate C-P lyase system protein PhnH [Actinomadura sp. 9N407]|uniref:phosphonate C-P lyase system protein PhnH n=1 Tax=Actinomadura sp. 9N407 TaxID=3375154 RepID=UPI0037A76F72